MTPEERARNLFASETTLDIVRHGDTFTIESLVADAIRQAVAEERERCARVAAESAEHHRDHCPPGCKCADGWHIACRIREHRT